MNTEAIERDVKRIGIKKFLSNPFNRKYWAAVQEKYKDEILQPNNPRFKQVYGNKLEQQRHIKEKQIRESQDQWAAHKDLKRYQASRLHPLIKNP